MWWSCFLWPWWTWWSLWFLSFYIALRYRIKLQQLNVETAFPYYADLEEGVFMAPPMGINVLKGYCLQIVKCLYELK